MILPVQALRYGPGYFRSPNIEMISKYGVEYRIDMINCTFISDGGSQLPVQILRPSNNFIVH